MSMRWCFVKSWSLDRRAPRFLNIEEASSVRASRTPRRLKTPEKGRPGGRSGLPVQHMTKHQPRSHRPYHRDGRFMYCYISVCTKRKAPPLSQLSFLHPSGCPLSWHHSLNPLCALKSRHSGSCFSVEGSQPSLSLHRQLTLPVAA